jgi:hypothetical protein
VTCVPFWCLSNIASGFCSLVEVLYLPLIRGEADGKIDCASGVKCLLDITELVQSDWNFGRLRSFLLQLRFDGRQ